MTYSQTTGIFTGPGISATGYSGRSDGLNNPSMQSVHDVGPIPQGDYTIQAPHADPKVGPIAMRLVPWTHNTMFGRGSFLIHGDNAQQNHSASEGCIILPRDVRVKIGISVLNGDNQLTVAV